MKETEQKRNRKRYLVFLTICLAVVVVALDLLFLILPDRTSSETENRNLQQFPKMTWNAVTQGRFESQFDDYVADQFPGRDFWVSLETTTARLAGNTLSHDIFLGKDGYLLQRFDEPSKEEYQKILQEMTDLAAGHPELNTYAMIVPTAVSILQDKLPAFAYDQISGAQDSFLDRLFSDLQAAGIQTVDVRDTLRSMAQQGQQVYYRTDHHWTTDAAFQAYQTWSAAAGTESNGISYERLQVSDHFQGTLSASSGFRISETDAIYVYLSPYDTADVSGEFSYAVTNMDTGEKEASLYDTSYLETRDQYAMFLGGNHGELKIQTTAEGDRNLLIIKDSYANCFIPFLVPDFANLIVIDPRYYLGDLEQLIRDEGITDLLFLYNAGTL